jgi:peroxiredoxin
MSANVAQLLSPGQLAPDATLPDAHGHSVNLSHLWAQGPLVLYFYPKDDTPGCTTQALEFSALQAEFAALNARVIGVSKDPCQKHQKFIDKHDLRVMLLSDEQTQLCEAYGVWQEKKNYGKTYFGIVRSTFVIDTQGILREVQYGVKAAGHAQEILNRVQQL